MDTQQQPLSGVSVTSALGSTATDANGGFELTGTQLGEVVVTFAKEGYVTRADGSVLVAGQVTARHAVLIAEAPAISADATTGGSISGPRGVELTIPPGSLVDGSGTPVTGMVDVHLTPIDPSRPEEAAAVGGTMLGQTKAGDTALIESFGMADVTVRQGGATLQIADGQQLDIAIPVPASVASPAAETGLWTYDKAGAQWVEEGTMSYDPASGAYRASVAHMSMWNSDHPADRTCVCGYTTNSSGAPLGGVIMSGQGVDYLGINDGVSGADGRFCLVVRKSSTLQVGPYPFGLGGETRQVQSGTVDTDVPPANEGAACLDIGSWTIDQNAYFPPSGSGSGGGGGCNVVVNPLAGTCAAAMGDFASCWDPSGACTNTADSSGAVTTTYANGAHFDGQVSPDGATFSGTFTSSNGTSCGSMSVVVATNTITFTTPSGTQLTIQNNADGSSIYTCADGTQITLSPDDNAALRACYSTGASQGGQCTFQGNGQLGSVCQSTSDCAQPLVCCSVQGSMICLDQATCSQLNP
jgi:hypothetical protein